MVKLHTQESHEQLQQLLEDLKAAEAHMNDTLRRLGAGETSREEAREAIQREEEARQRYEAMDAQYRIPTDGSVVEYEYPETIDDEELRGRLESSDLPRVLVGNVVRTLDQGRRSRWIAVLKHDADGVLDRLNSLLATGRRITGLDSDTLMACTDLTEADTGSGRLDAAIAELRGIAFLDHQRFDGVTPQKANPDTASTDLVAERQGRRFALDVACSNVMTAQTLESLTGYVVGRCEEKAGQVAATMREAECHACGVITVLNSDPALVLGDQRDYRGILEQAYRELGSPPDFYLGLVTGLTRVGSDFSGPDDTVFPGWPG